MADTGDLKSPAEFPACGFESRLRHQKNAFPPIKSRVKCVFCF